MRNSSELGEKRALFRLLAFATNSSQSIFDTRKRRRWFKPMVECNSEGYRVCRLGLVGFNRFGAECEKNNLSRLFSSLG